MSDPLLVHFEDLETGQVVPLGACAVDQAALDAFVERFAPVFDALATASSAAAAMAGSKRVISDSRRAGGNRKLPLFHSRPSPI